LALTFHGGLGLDQALELWFVWRAGNRVLAQATPTFWNSDLRKPFHQPAIPGVTADSQRVS